MPAYNGWQGAYHVPDISQSLSTMVEASDQFREKRENKAIGEAAATGKLSDAAGVAFKQGNVKTGLALKDLDDDRRMKVGKIIGEAALNADTPEKWAQLQASVAKRFPGEELEPFEERDGVVSMFRDHYKERELAQRDRAISVSAQKSSGEGGVFGNPIYGEDPETGQTVLGVIGKDGQFRRLDTGGVKITPGVTFQDLGTHRQGYNTKTGAVAGPAIPIDNTGKAADVAEGKGIGEARTSLVSMKSKMPGLEKVVAELNTLADEATYTVAGQALDAGRRQVGMEPRAAAVARTKYVSMVDNQVLPLLRDTFGAAFTVQEGESLRATLGDPNKTPTEKKAVLESFIEQKRRDVESLEAQSNGGKQSAPKEDPLGIR